MYSLGKIFSISLYGESHGKVIGVLVYGCPSGIKLSEECFTKDLDRRKSGAKGTTPRREEDNPSIMSGVFNGYTTGAPINITFANEQAISKDYLSLSDTPRPGHADFVAHKKYGGYNDYRGGGHFSGRLTLALVAAGVIAKKIIGKTHPSAHLVEAGGSTQIEQAIDKALKAQDSIGGIVECRVSKVPIGLGEPFFYSLESQLSYAIFAIPAIKGIDFGAGFRAAQMRGSEHNDTLIDEEGTTSTNHAGGINGGISNGNDIVFRVAVKPTSSISRTQQTLRLSTGKVDALSVKGRHDACIALRVPVVVEAVTAIVLADSFLLDQQLSRVRS